MSYAEPGDRAVEDVTAGVGRGGEGPGGGHRFHRAARKRRTQDRALQDALRDVLDGSADDGHARWTAQHADEEPDVWLQAPERHLHLGVDVAGGHRIQQVTIQQVAVKINACEDLGQTGEGRVRERLPEIRVRRVKRRAAHAGGRDDVRDGDVGRVALIEQRGGRLPEAATGAAAGAHPGAGTGDDPADGAGR